MRPKDGSSQTGSGSQVETGDGFDRTTSIGDCVNALLDIGAAVGVPSALHHLPDLVKQVREMAERAESRDTRLAAAEGQAAAAVEEVRAGRVRCDGLTTENVRLRMIVEGTLANPNRCTYVTYWGGQCTSLGAVDGLCARHRGKTCEGCGSTAVVDCRQTVGLVCGAPLCAECEHLLGGGHGRAGWQDGVVVTSIANPMEGS